MARAPRSQEPGWGRTLLTLGFAAVIAGVATITSDLIRTGAEQRWRTCDRAAAVLQDATLTPYLAETARRRIAAVAAQQFEQCVTEGR